MSATVQAPARINAGSVTKRAKYRCRVKETWAGEWYDVDYLEPLAATVAAPPSVPAASFRLRLGQIKHEDLNEFRAIFATKLRDQFVMVETLGDGASIPSSPYGPTGTSGAGAVTPFVGRFTDEALETKGKSRGPTGEQMLTAYGLAHELDKNVIASSVCTNDGSATIRIDPVLIFNDDLVKGYVEAGNRSLTKPAEPDNGAISFVFSNEKFGDGSNAIWSVRDIIEYLIERHGPKDLLFTLGGAVEALAEIEPPEFRVAGMTVFGAITKLVDRRHGLGWDVRVSSNGATAEIYVFTTVDRAVTFDDATLPANPNTADIPVDDLGHLVRESRLRFDSLAEYDRIVINGAPLLVCCTVAFKDKTLEKAWDADLENTYKAARESTSGGAASPTPTGKQNDDARKNHIAWDRVYTTFRIPKTWECKAGDGAGGNKTSVNAKVDDNGRVTIPPTEFAPIRDWGHRLERHLPLRKPKISGADVAGAAPEYYLPFALVKNADGKFELSHKATVKGSGSLGSLRMLDRDFGFEVQASPNHVLAKGSWTSAASSDFNPDSHGFDYREILATVAFRTDARLKVVVDLDDRPRTGSLGAFEPERVLQIDVPNAEFWWIAPNTVKDIGANGDLTRETRTGNALVLRDDGDRLRTIGALAKAWYGKPRSSLTLQLNGLVVSYPIGTYIRSVVDAWQNGSVNSVVSCLTYDFVAQTTTIQTQYCELDVVAGGGPSKSLLR